MDEKSNIPEGNYPDLSIHKSYMAQAMTPEIYNKLWKVKCPSGYTLDNAIQCGVDNPKPGIGVQVGDEAAYTLWADLMDVVVEKRHNGFTKADTHSSDLDYRKITNGQFDEKYVISTRVRTARNLRGFPLPPAISRAERRGVEALLRKVFAQLPAEVQGEYFRLPEMSPELVKEKVDEHIMFAKPTSTMHLASGMARDWPDGRGIFHNKDKTFVLWVNEEDHMRIVSMQMGGNMGEVFARLSTAIQAIADLAKKEGGVEFQWHDRLGNVSACPSNLGTSLRASVHVKLPNLSRHPLFAEMNKKLRLQARGTRGEDDESNDGTVDLSNFDRIGKSEVELVQTAINGVHKAIELEKKLEQGQSIDADIAAL